MFKVRNIQLLVEIHDSASDEEYDQLVDKQHGREADANEVVINFLSKTTRA